MKHLIAVDLDGTLFGVDGRVSERTRLAVESVIASGHMVVAVTGRSWWSAVPRLKEVAGISRIVCSNGAYEYRVDRREIVWSNAINLIDIDIWCGLIRRRFPSASFGWESTSGHYYDEDFIAAAGGKNELEQGGDSSPKVAASAYKLLVRTPDVVRGELQHALADVLGDLAEVTTSGVPFVEVSAPGVNKAAGLSRVAADLNMSCKQTLVFGDNLNDVSMLAWANHSIAMGNAVDEVKSIADHTTLSNEDHGVAVVLEKLVADYNVR